MSSILKSFFKDTITSIHSVSRNGYGDLTRTTVYTDVPCRWNSNPKQSYKDKAKNLQYVQDIEYNAEVWISYGDYTILETYEFYYGSKYYRILKLFKEKNVFGSIDHYRLLLV